MLVGFGKDIHNLKKGSEITLGGKKFNSKWTIIAHSDGDVIYHSLSNAILSVLELNDIGFYFSDKDIKNKNINSEIILNFALNKLIEKNLFLNNLVICITCQKIKISPLILDILKNVNQKLTNFFYDKKTHITLHATSFEKNSNKQIECECVISVR